MISEYESIVEVKEKTRISGTKIRMVCVDERKTAGNFQWRYKEHCDKNTILEPCERKNVKKKILQISLEGKIIREFDGITKASRQTKINRPNIISVLNRDRKSAGGHPWIYKEDYDEDSVEKFYKIKNRKKAVIQLTADNISIKEFMVCFYQTNLILSRSKQT